MQNKPDSSEENSTAKNASKKKQWKTNLRQQYFLERELIRNEIGDLRQIRESLGLSQRRLCQLLLVDPSAWTRWLKEGAPPHIYQALRWLVSLKKTNPDVTGPRDLSSRVDEIHSSTQTKIEALEKQVAMLERELALKSTATYTPDTELTQMALRSQEQRFQAEILRLEERFKNFTTPPPKIKAKMKKHVRKSAAPKRNLKMKKKPIRAKPRRKTTAKSRRRRKK